MYYSGGNYEAFSSPGAGNVNESGKVYIIGSGIAALSAACFLIRDGGVRGENIHILERNPIPGGALDGYSFDNIGFVLRSDRSVDEHSECLWDLFRSIPAAGGDESVLDEFCTLNRNDPNYSLCRVTKNRGEEEKLEGKYGLSDSALRQVIKVFFAADTELYGKKISDVFDSEVTGSNFWLYLRTLLGFENWHGAIEMKRCLRRFIHHVEGLPDFKDLKFTKYNQYESMILPLMEYLEPRGVVFEYGVRVQNVIFDCGTSKKIANRIDIIRDGEEDSIDLTRRDLVFITNGSVAENTGIGSQDECASYNTEIREGGSFDLWRNIAGQNSAFGHPDVFCTAPEHTSRVSATITTLDRTIIPYIKKISKRDPFSGRTVTGGIVTVRDSSWLLNWSVGRQPRFRGQDKDQVVISLYGLYTDRPGDYVGKTMRDASGMEICEEWLYHIGVPEEQIREIAANHARCVPVVMPYVTAVYMPRSEGDRPKVVPDGAVNFAFIGQFAETKDDSVLTMEYSVRTAMEAVYTLLDLDRAVPAVWNGSSDIRVVSEALVRLSDGKTLREMKLGFFERMLVKRVLKKLKRTELMLMLEKLHVV